LGRTAPQARAGPEPPGDRAVPDRLIAAIQDQTLTAEVAALAARPDAPAIVAAAAEALAGIARDTRDARDAGIAALRHAGIPAEADPIDCRQFQHFTVRVPADRIAPALRVAATLDYVVPQSLGPAALRALRHTQPGLGLMRGDAVTMRMTLRWGQAPSRLRRRLMRLAAPRMGDLQAVAPPAPLWPLYFVIRPLRTLSGRARRDAAHYDPGLNLGTPEPLIAPLLRVAGVTAAETLLDLGCGDGRVLVAAARDIGCAALGVERDAALARRARSAARDAGVAERVRVVTGTATAEEIAQADVIFLFQPMSRLAAMLDRIRPHLRPGARILAHEQSPLAPELAPDLAVPVFAANALSVAHVWRA